jgi:hypothetical protein
MEEWRGRKEEESAGVEFLSEYLGEDIELKKALRVLWLIINIWIWLSAGGKEPVEREWLKT